MEGKRINFHIYRYHLNPIESNTTQLNLFDGNKMSKQEIKEKKNDFLYNIITDKLSVGTASNPMTLVDNDGNYFLLKIANRKKTKIIKDFKPTVHEHEPYAFIIIIFLC